MIFIYDFRCGAADASLEECILQAKGEHVPAEQNIELQDEQPNLENMELPVEDEYVAGAYPVPFFYGFFIIISPHFYFPFAYDFFSIFSILISFS